VSQRTKVLVCVAAVLVIVATLLVWKTNESFEVAVFKAGAAIAAVVLVAFAITDDVTRRMKTAANGVTGRVKDPSGAVTDIENGLEVGIVSQTVEVIATERHPQSERGNQ
jgi:hypothetical protein